MHVNNLQAFIFCLGGILWICFYWEMITHPQKRACIIQYSQDQDLCSQSALQRKMHVLSINIKHVLSAWLIQKNKSAEINNDCISIWRIKHPTKYRRELYKSMAEKHK